jgi:parallel beta-helix repeat protein
MRKTRMRRIVSWIMFAFLLLGTLTLAFNVGLVHAQAETIYINSDGSVVPSYAPISSADNITYTFTGNTSYPAYNGIIVERSNIVIDGNGYTVQGIGRPIGNQNGALYDQSTGLNLTDTENVTIKNANIENFQNGVYLFDSNNNVISGNNATANGHGIHLDSSSNNNTVSGNNATANSGYGIYLVSSSSNSIIGNNITDNGYGIVLKDSSSSNSISGNNITNNVNYGVWLDSSLNNTVYGNNNTDGVELDSSSNNKVYGNSIASDPNGVWLGSSSNNTISENNITTNVWAAFTMETDPVEGVGVMLSGSSNNTVSKNNIHNNELGVALRDYSNNTVSENIITDNYDGIDLEPRAPTASAPFLYSSDNVIYHNSFINNVQQAFGGLRNVWDNGYASGGNYWSDYSGTDLYSGPYQNETGCDWIGDSPYVVDQNNTDRYPLMHPYSPETDEIETAYRGLLADYDTLLANFTTLNTAYQQHLLDYSSLQSNYTSLQSSFNALNASYSLLNSTLNSLNTAFNDYKTSTQNELNYTRDFLYSLTAITAILIATVLYLAKRKPKTQTTD